MSKKVDSFSTAWSPHNHKEKRSQRRRDAKNAQSSFFAGLCAFASLRECFCFLCANLVLNGLLFFAMLYGCSAALRAQTISVPYLIGHVNDYANMLSLNATAELEAALKAHEDSTSNQVAVLIIPSLEGAVLEEYSIKVVETWKLGRADKDNGVLLLIARDDRKVRMEVGNGLEGDLPDIMSGRIIRNQIVPRFKEGNYEAGVRDGVHAILAAIQGAYVATEEENSSQPDWMFRLIFFGIFMLVVGVFTVISVVTGGGAGWFLYFFLMPFWLAFPMVSFGVVGGGILFGLYVIVVGAIKIWLRSSKAGQAAGKTWSKKWAGSQLKRGRGGSWSSGSSWSSSSWSSSSGSSFSGGGGSFSGGGASGSW